MAWGRKEIIVLFAVLSVVFVSIGIVMFSPIKVIPYECGIPADCREPCGNSIPGCDQGGCDKRTHVCCGDYCCPGDDAEKNCDSQGGISFCKVTKDQCGKIKTVDGRSYKFCKAGGTGIPFVSNKKTICCHPDKVCAKGAFGIPVCAYPGGEDDCPDGTSFCRAFKDGGVLCCVTGKEQCMPIKQGDSNTVGCVRMESTCPSGSTVCKGQGDWQNVQCCGPQQTCTIDGSGFARCQGPPGEPVDPPPGKPFGDPPGLGESQGINNNDNVDNQACNIGEPQPIPY